jgi:uncharacterized surface protein with fasciclin (FAS1) repeats
MKSRTLVASLVGAAAIATMAIAAPNQASAGASGDAVVNAVVSSSQFDVLEAVLVDLGLVETVAGLENATIFAPADASFRGLVADLLNVPIWNLPEAEVIRVLTTVVPQDVLAAVVSYHVGFKQLDGTYTMLDTQTVKPVRFFGITFLEDKDNTDLNPFIVGRTNAGTNTVFTIAGVLRPTELKNLFPLD